MESPTNVDGASVQSIVRRLCQAFGVTIRVKDDAEVSDEDLRDLVADMVEVSSHRRKLEVGEMAIGRIKSELLKDRLDLEINMTTEVEEALRCGMVCQVHSHGYITDKCGQKYNGSLVLVPGDGIEWESKIVPASRRN